MKTGSLKIPFIVSLAFHSVVFFSIAFLLSPSKGSVLDITPVKILSVAPVEERLQDVSEPLPTPMPLSPIEQVFQGVKLEPSLPLAEESLERPSNESSNLAESVEQPSNEAILKSEAEFSNNSEIVILQNNNIDSSGEAITGEETQSSITASAGQLKQADSNYGVTGGTDLGGESELNLFRGMVRHKIEKAKFYPRWARERGFEGIVGVRFIVLPDGGVGDIKVVRPCHDEILNKAAYETIMKAAPFHPGPKELEAREMAMEIDISYRLD